MQLATSILLKRREWMDFSSPTSPPKWRKWMRFTACPGVSYGTIHKILHGESGLYNTSLLFGLLNFFLTLLLLLVGDWFAADIIQCPKHLSCSPDLMKTDFFFFPKGGKPYSWAYSDRLLPSRHFPCKTSNMNIHFWLTALGKGLCVY